MVEFNNANEIDSSIIHNIYEMSFPKTEKFDWNILKECNNEPNVHLDGILKNHQVVGMTFTVGLPNSISYLMYFAIDKKYRNNGIGSEVLHAMIKNNTLMLIIEKPVDKLTQSRKDFYLRNSFYSTNIYFEDTGVEYEVLVSKQNYKPTKKDLLDRYRCMTTDSHIFENIRNSFNAETINFLTT